MLFKKLYLALGIVVIAAGCQSNTGNSGNTDSAQSASSTAGTVVLENATLAGDEKIQTPYGTVELVNNYITDESSKKLFDALDAGRAAQAYIWSTPIVSFYTWKKEQEKVYGTEGLGKFAVFESFNEKQGIVTGNLTTPYIISFYDLSKGALSIDYPGGQTAGGLMDLWQRPLSDMGLTGPDGGKGGKYVIYGPEDKGNYKKPGVYTYQSATNIVFIGLRLLDPDPEFAKKFKSSLKMGKVGEPLQPVSFVEGLNKKWNATAPRGLEYWKYLSEILQIEPVREQDKVWMAMLEPLGIKKGVAFSPDERLQKILKEGAALGELYARNNQVNPRFAEYYWPGTHWYKSFDFQTEQETDYKVQLDERATWFYEAVTSTKGMVTPTVGAGQVYMTAKRDKDGNFLRADKTYKLTVPKDVPIKQFWAVTLYSENTRRPYENGGTEAKTANISSRDTDLKTNADGTVDIYVGPQAPEGKETNFMKTVGTDGWFMYFRLYAPTEPFFDKSFKLPDWELVK